MLTKAPGNDAEIGGLKVVSEGGWFAARPSGTEDVYKVYAESFRSEEHLERIIAEAQEIVKSALDGVGCWPAPHLAPVLGLVRGRVIVGAALALVRRPRTPRTRCRRASGSWSWAAASAACRRWTSSAACPSRSR